MKGIRWLAGVSMLLCIACGGEAGTAGETGGRAADGGVPVEGADSLEAAVGEAISAAWATHIAAARRDDTVAVMDLYAPDITYIVPPADPVVGRDALRVQEVASLSTAEVLEANHRTLDLRVIEDRAYEIGVVSGAVRTGTADPERVVFDYMALWRRQAGGGWAIQYLLGGG